MKLLGASSLIGREVTFKTLDDNGEFYKGTVQNIVKNGDSIKLNVLLGDKSVQAFELSDVTQIT